MKFSICVPNYNYAKFLERTLRSALDQDHPEIELVFCDNKSTDDSVARVRALGDPRVVVRENQANVGFAGNLDRTVRASSGEAIVLLPSDDLLRPGCLSVYAQLFERLGRGLIVSSSLDMIDPADTPIGVVGPDTRLWRPEDRAPELEAITGGPTYQLPAAELLKRSLVTMTNPFNLQTTAYLRPLYEAVEGYGGGRLINPDKWFHWRLLGAAETAVFVDRSLGACRWHPNNQTAQQASSGALKYLVDEYVSTFELDPKLLERLGLSRGDLEARFVEYDIARHGLATLAAGQRGKAERIALFGRATYPSVARKNLKLWGLRALIAAGPVGEAVTRVAYRAYLARNPRGEQWTES